MIKKLTLLFLIICILCSCSALNKGEQLSGSAYYFDSKDKNKLTSVNISLSSKNVEDAARELFNRLYTPEKNSLVPVLSKGIHLIDLSVAGPECTLTLSPAYNYLSEPSLVALNNALTNTMCSLPEITTVSICCEGDLTSFEQNDFLCELPVTYYDSQTVTLYYTKDAYTNVVGETVNILISREQTLEKTVVLRLKNAPVDSGFQSPFPEGTEINNVYFDEGTCVVDVTPDFVTNAIHGKKEEKNILFSIVNTLTQLPKIDRVKFLIDGKDGYGYTYYDISNPLANAAELFYMK